MLLPFGKRFTVINSIYSKELVLICIESGLEQDKKVWPNYWMDNHAFWSHFVFLLMSDFYIKRTGLIHNASFSSELKNGPNKLGRLSLASLSSLLLCNTLAYLTIQGNEMLWIRISNSPVLLKLIENARKNVKSFNFEQSRPDGFAIKTDQK